MHEKQKLYLGVVLSNRIAMNYQDFQIFVDKNKNIRASSEQGEIRSELRLDMNDIGLALELIESEKTNNNLLKKLGSQLYQALFPTKSTLDFTLQ
ncbi:hypothetical protein Riv7116_0210 [Rivularia sp. PCC 7116]|uniref:hypothetical protein n=1 Tax=Rivularia sp. PCC 7116 TaxID=373994 RepID=UPI00029ED1E8|nr:hypothetical protein [Rivularia sp. PCC 7116]AFY52817.1 hypothetical protein Riv7116_0210 [Rivularia sp. PCC 7116]